MLFDRLAGDGWSVLGLGRTSARSSSGAARTVDIADRTDVRTMFDEWSPDVVFYLPAVHASSDSATTESDDLLFERSIGVHAQYAVNFLEAISNRGSGTAFFYAGSSHVFAGANADRQTEDTPIVPESIYAITKAAGIHACRFYRSRKGVRASVGILYNHESHLRPDSFVSQRIVKAAIRAAGGDKCKLELGDLSACVDWGYAPEYVEAMILITELPDANDYIIATGQSHSVREFAESAFECVGLDWRDHVVEHPSILSQRSRTLVGDYRRLHERTGWEPRISFRGMIRKLIDQAGQHAH